MWSDPKRKSSTSIMQKKSNLRLVPKTKWELPKQKHKSYWQNVFEDIDKSSMKVNQPLFSLFPTSLTIPLESSVSIRDKPLTDPVTPDVKTIIIKNEPIVKISPPSPSHDEKEAMILFQKSPITDSLEYLKSHDVSNFDLDLLTQNLESDEKILQGENAVETEKEKEFSQTVKTPLIFPEIGKISQLTKISRYVNDFLASTKVKMRGSIPPQRQSSSERPRGGHCIIDGTLIDHNDRIHPEESPPAPEDDHTHKEEPESPEIQQKHVVFEDTAEDDAETIENSYGRVSRPRAPSLGVASLVPSFGKMISSLEYSDSVGSRSSIESPPDDANIIDGISPSLRQSQQTPDMKRKIYLEAPAVHYPSKSIYPDVRRLKDSGSKFSGGSQPKSYQHWPRRTIVHTIRALKTMKSGAKAGERSHHKLMKFRSSSSFIQGHSIVRKSSSSSGELASPTIDASGSTTSSDDNTTQTVLRTISRKVMVEERLKQVPLMKKPSFRLEDLPPMGGMYQRKKRNKCLACMCRSRIELEPVFRLPGQIDVTPYESVMAEFHDLLAMKLTERITKSRRSEFTDDEVSPLPEDSKPSAIDDFFSFETRPMRASHLDRKFTQSSVREDLVSSKSFVSTLSLTSEQSRTISEQEDSDHGLETVAEAGEELPGAGSKFRAPCHAPLNLKPSLEPLMALKGKKSKSIQSRSASLEKSMEEGSEEDSDDDDDEVEATAVKLRAEEVKELLPLKAGDRQIPDAVEDPSKPDKPSPEPELEPQKSPVSDHEEDHVVIPTPDIAISTQSGDVPLSEMIYNQLNVKIRSTDHNPSRSFYSVSPFMSDSEIMEIAKKSLDADKPIKDIFASLLEEYCHRLSMKTSDDTSLNDHSPQRIAKITNRLLALLVDSKLYLNPEFTSSNLQFSSKQKPFCNSQQLRRFLPFKSYNLVAPILGMPEWLPKRWSTLKSARSLKAGFKSKVVTTMVDDASSVSVVSTKTESGDDFDLIVHPPSPRESLDEVSESQKQKKMNPYASFISKPRRKVVIWRPLAERDLEGYDPDSTLKNRAAKVTDKICKDFCDWLRSLGGSHDSIDEEILKDMFETDFSAEACRTMRVCVKEMPMVPTAVATIRHCQESGEPEVTRRQLIRDVEAERKSPKIVGFGSTVPHHLRYEPPRNKVYDNWIHCSRVPQDLESMSFVWKDITHLDSVRGFSHWLKRQSRVKLPKSLHKIKKTIPQ